MRFNFLVLCTTFVHTWTLGNGLSDKHSVWMGSRVSLPSSEKSSVAVTSLDSFDVNGYINASVHVLSGGALDPNRPMVQIVTYNWFVNGYRFHRGELCNNGCMGKVLLDGAIYLPSLVFYIDGKNLSKQLTLQSIKLGFYLDTPTTYFISNNCVPYNAGHPGAQIEPTSHFACCTVKNQLGEDYAMMVYVKGLNASGSGTAASFGIAHGPLGTLLPHPVKSSGYGCLNGLPNVPQ